jgi:cytochrome c oxidase subunit 1
VLLSLGLMMVGTVFAVIGGVIFVISMLRISLKDRHAGISAN